MNHLPWHDRARELLATGMRVQQVADAIGKSDDIVRVALNLNGAGDRFQERLARLKARKAQAREAVPVVVTRSSGITLPFVSILAGHQSENYQLAPRDYFGGAAR